MVIELAQAVTKANIWRAFGETGLRFGAADEPSNPLRHDKI
jgi:hypothetical protein